MRQFARCFRLLFASSLVMLTTLGGCAKIGEAIDCEQMCEELKTCVESDLDVHRCSDRCEDKTDTSAMRNQLDDCTDCLDQGYACAELSEQCPMCKDISDSLL